MTTADAPAPRATAPTVAALAPHLLDPDVTHPNYPRTLSEAAQLAAMHGPAAVCDCRMGRALALYRDALTREQERHDAVLDALAREQNRHDATFGPYEGETREVVALPEQAMIVTSAMLPAGYHVYGDRGSDLPHHGHVVHRPVIDLDLPAQLVPSSTPGHHHLYIDKPMAWDVYMRLLVALADAGLVERGYVGATERRGYSAVRLPWVRKGDDPLAELRTEQAGTRP